MRQLFFLALAISLLSNGVLGRTASKKRQKKLKRMVSSIKSNKSTKKLQSKNFIKNLSGDYKFKIASNNIEDTTSKANWVQFSLSSNINYRLLKPLNFKFAPYASFSSGNSQTIYGGLEPKNRIGISEALLEYSPIYFLSINAGILSQKRVHNELLIRGSVSFPSAEAVAHLVSYNNIFLDTSFQNAIPTSYSFDSEASSKEKTPNFQTASLSLKLTPYKFMTYNLFATRFSFKNLTSNVAQKSRLLGNSVSDEYNFDNKYAGYSLSSDFNIDFGKYFSVKLLGNYLLNEKAKRGMNSANLIGIEATTHFMRDVDLTSSITKFKIEPDASPAYYNSIRFGNSNRLGYSYEAALSFNKYFFKITAQHIDGHLLYKSLSQSRRKSYSIWLETLNVEF